MQTSSTRLRSILLSAILVVPGLLLAQIIERPKASIQLCFQRTSGTNGSAVAYNPDKNLYYAHIAGNETFPLEVFDANGNNLYQTETRSDMRGLWWNPKTKQLEGNGYGSIGIVGMMLDQNGYPSLGNTTIYEGDNHQPSDNSCGVYDGKKYVWYYSDGQFHMYSRKSGKRAKSFMLPAELSVEQINNTSLIYTGIKGMELGILNYEDQKVYLINQKTGELAKTIHLPESAVTNYSFRFAYANKHVFLYDIEERCWTGYQITM